MAMKENKMVGDQPYGGPFTKISMAAAAKAQRRRRHGVAGKNKMAAAARRTAKWRSEK